MHLHSEDLRHDDVFRHNEASQLMSKVQRAKSSCSTLANSESPSDCSIDISTCWGMPGLEYGWCVGVRYWVSGDERVGWGLGGCVTCWLGAQVQLGSR